MQTRLYRSRTDSMVAGVCGGLGEYLRIDSTIVRIFFVLLALGSGIGVLLYMVLWLVIPRQGRGEAGTPETMRMGAEEIGERARAMSADVRESILGANPRAGIFVGVALVIVGIVFLLRELNVPWLVWLRFDLWWPVLLIIAGAALLWRRARGE